MIVMIMAMTPSENAAMRSVPRPAAPTSPLLSVSIAIPPIQRLRGASRGSQRTFIAPTDGCEKATPLPERDDERLDICRRLEAATRTKAAGPSERGDGN